MANFVVLLNVPKMFLTSHGHKIVFSQKYFMIFRNFNMFVSSAANLVSGKKSTLRQIAKNVVLDFAVCQNG